mgnify:CR=1 FL=1
MPSVIAPPNSTEGTAPSSFAASPDSKAPISFEVLRRDRQARALLDLPGASWTALLRAVLGDSQLNYLGYSYGTYLGASYAELHPERVGRFVLDGAIDPDMSMDEFSAGQAEGFEHATEAFLARCLEAGDACPFRGDEAEAKEQLLSFFESVDETPLDTGDPERPRPAAQGTRHRDEEGHRRSARQGPDHRADRAQRGRARGRRGPARCPHRRPACRAVRRRERLTATHW